MSNDIKKQTREVFKKSFFEGQVATLKWWIKAFEQGGWDGKSALELMKDQKENLEMQLEISNK